MPLLHKDNHMRNTKHKDEEKKKGGRGRGGGGGGGIVDINGWGVSHD
jgi:hypothetical protein